jgi:hypothetical protein
MRIRPFTATDLDAILKFTDREIGIGYYSRTELEDIFQRSMKNGVVCSLLLENENSGAIEGIRISFPPGQWTQGKGRGLSPNQWPHAHSETGYFQSVFLSAEVQGQGWGGVISSQSLRLLEQTGAKGVVCHSWKESPNNSSTRYLQKLGFVVVTEHPHYWKNVHYQCTRCLQPPCHCTAVEMYLDLMPRSTIHAPRKGSII